MQNNGMLVGLLFWDCLGGSRYRDVGIGPRRKGADTFTHSSSGFRV